MDLYFINRPLRTFSRNCYLSFDYDYETWLAHKKEWNQFKQFCNAVNAGTKEYFDFDFDPDGFIASSIHDARSISYEVRTKNYYVYENMVSKCGKYADNDKTPLNENGDAESYQAIFYEGKSLKDAIASFNKGSLFLKKRPYRFMW